MFPKFFYKQRVLEDMIVVAGNVHEKFKTSLRAIEELEARRKSGFHGRSLVEMVPLLDSALDAVAYAHIQGVVHRDLNPGNIFFALQHASATAPRCSSATPLG